MEGIEQLAAQVVANPLAFAIIHEVLPDQGNDGKNILRTATRVLNEVRGSLQHPYGDEEESEGAIAILVDLGFVENHHGTFRLTEQGKVLRELLWPGGA